MFTADLGDAQQNIYAIPLLVSVRLEREWPDTVRVIVVEREAWGTWEQAGVRYTIDRDGVVIGTTNPPPDGAPSIISNEAARLELGDRVDFRAVDATAEIYDKLPRQLGTTVSEVRFLGSKGVRVTTADGQSALLGDSGSISYKLAVWAAVTTEAERQGIYYTSIDLRYGNRPVLQ
jgi:cell division protein FtsQ